MQTEDHTVLLMNIRKSPMILHIKEMEDGWIYHTGKLSRCPGALEHKGPLNDGRKNCVLFIRQALKKYNTRTDQFS